MATANITSTISGPAPIMLAPGLFEHFTNRAVQITGCMPDDSMAPKIQKDDLLQIEPCERISTGGFTYAFEIDGWQFVRMLDLRLDGEVDVIPLNPLWSRDRIPGSDAHKIKLIGRVVGVLQYRSVV